MAERSQDEATESSPSEVEIVIGDEEAAPIKYNKRGMRVWGLSYIDILAKPDPVQAYDADERKGVPLVIDIGAYTIKAGWADKPEPSLVFRSRVARARKGFGETVGMMVGNDISNRESLRAQYRNYMEAGVVTNFITQEEIFDHIFSRLGINTPSIDHPVVLTERVCAPIFTRARFFEMLYMAYGVPRIGLGVGCLVSNYLQTTTRPSANGSDDKYAIVIQIGHSATHIVPLINGRMDSQNCKRVNIGAASTAHYLHNLLRLKYPQHAESFTDVEVEEMTFTHMYVSNDYVAELKRWEDPQHTVEHTRVVQLPFVRPNPITIEERKKRKEEQGKRLQDLMRKKREKKLAEHQAKLDKLVSVLSWPTDQKQRIERKKLGYATIDEFNLALDEERETVRRQSNKLAGIEEEEVEEKKEMVYDLIDRPDSELTEAQKAEKKKQRFLKSTADGRERARLEKERLKEIKAEEQRQDDLAREANPEAWVLSLREEKASILQTRKVRNRKREALKNSRSGVSKQRMRLMVEQFGDGDDQTKSQPGRRSKRNEDTFGKKDSEWDVYRVLGGDEGDSENEREEEQLTHIEAKLAEHDPTYSGENAPVDIEEYNQIELGVERFRVAEVFFQPSIVGDGEAGLTETVEWVLNYYPADIRAKMVKNIHITGGGALLPGLEDRIESEMRCILPFKSEFKVNVAQDPVLDEWKGAAKWSLAQLKQEKQSPEEKSLFLDSCRVDVKAGLEGLLEHSCSNDYYQLPQ